MDRQELRNRLNGLRVIDVHEHFETYDQTFGYSMPQFLYYGAYVNTMASALPKEWILEAEAGANEAAQFEALVRLYKKIRHTSCGKILQSIASQLGGSLCAEECAKLSDAYAARSKIKVGSMNPMIEAYICNSAGHPLYGYVRGLKGFLNGEIHRDEKMHRTLCITGLHCVHNRDELEDIAYAAEEAIDSLGAWETAAEKIIERFIKMGVVGFKDIYMYYRPLTIGAPAKEEAARAFERMMAGEPATVALLDYMMFQTYEMISKYRLPVQIHTGGIITTCESAQYLGSITKIMREFPDIPFDLLHLNYPLLDEYIMVLKSCENAYADCTWITSTDRAYAARFLEQAVDLLPAERVILFGGDRHCAGEPVAAALHMTLDVLGDVLSGFCEKKTATPSAVLELAETWLYEAPKQLFCL